MNTGSATCTLWLWRCFFVFCCRWYICINVLLNNYSAYHFRMKNSLTWHIYERWLPQNLLKLVLAHFLVIYSAVVRPSLVPGSDIHQESAITYSVGASIMYLTTAARAFVVPPVAVYFTAIRKSSRITDQKNTCAQSERKAFYFSSSIVSCDCHRNSSYSCEVCGWYPTVTPSPSSPSPPP